MRKIVRSFLEAAGLRVVRYSLFERAVHLLANSQASPFFLQIGANNGIDFDDFYSIVAKYDLPGIVVEPIPYYFDTLREVYKTHPGVIPIRAAIHPSAESVSMFRVNPDMVTIPWQHGLASFSRENFAVEFHQVPEEAILEEQVPCLSLSRLLEQHLPHGKRVDIMVSDTEGYDEEIMKMVDLQTLRPRVIRFESKHLTPEGLTTIGARLRDAGYLVEKGKADWVAVDKPLASRLRYFRSSL